MVAVVTPMQAGVRPDTELDYQAFEKLLEFHIEQGTDAIVSVGTSGESATLTEKEHCEVIGRMVEIVNGRIPVIAGTGANSTLEAIALTRCAKKVGADACLLVTPYYNKPSQEGLYLHFKTIAEAVDIPMFLYNVPGRTAINMLPETVARLAEVPNIIGIKEACGSLQQISEIIRRCPTDFIVLSGDDFTAMPTVLIGGKGVISVTSNVDPRGMADLMEAALAGDLKKANEIHYRLFPLMTAMFCAPNPVPAKKGVELMGKIKDGLPRLPLSAIDNAALASLSAAMKEAGLL